VVFREAVPLRDAGEFAKAGALPRGAVPPPCYPSLKLFGPRAEGNWNFAFGAAGAELPTLARAWNV
jgi:hypothetical protein